MIYSFLTPKGMLVRTEDGRNCVFAEEIRFRGEDGSMWRVLPGASTDWASTPAITWAELPPFGEYARAAGIHDTAYRNTLERQRQDGTWAKAFPDCTEDMRKLCDDLLLDIMTCDRVNVVTRDIIYTAVRQFGWPAFAKDRQPTAS